MLRYDYTVAVARALDRDAPAVGSLDRLAVLLPQVVPGCRAASAVRWRHGRATEVAASHRSVADLLACQLERGSGPTLDAVRAGYVWCPDTWHADPWPGFRSGSLRAGVRSLVALVRRSGADAVTATLYGVRPGLPGLDTAALVWLLAFGGTALPGDDRRSAATAGRARGQRPALPAGAARHRAELLLAQALGAGRPAACGLLRAVARARRCGTGDAARWLIAEQARALGQVRGMGAAPACTQQACTQQPARPAARRRQAAGTGPRKVVPQHPRTPPVRSGPGGPCAQTPAPSRGQRRPPAAQGASRLAAGTGRRPRSQSLAGEVEHALRLRRELAGSASLIARTGARLADTLDQNAESRPRDAQRLHAKAITARKYALAADRLAADFRKDPRRRSPGNV